jgi:uncharacterized protein (DUF362 family)/Pyruvate/2-oxoacid:ferredoxin oxidoreductase delta subunit
MSLSVAVRKIENYNVEEIREALTEFITNANSARLDSARTVLIKPNLLGAFAPEQAVTTHPAVVEALILVLQEMGKEVWLGDSPGGSGNAKNVWLKTGMQALADKYKIELVNFSGFGVQEIESEGMKLTISKVAWEADAIINVGKLKTHSLMAYTGAIKNLYGLVPGMIKTEYHKLYPGSDTFGKMLTSLYRIVRHRAVYHILDGIVGMDGAGPSAGRARNFGLLLGSVSAPALDYLAASFMGFKLDQVGYVKAALHADGIIPSQIEYPISFREFRLTKVNYLGAALSSRLLRHVPKAARLILRQVYDFYPVITETCQSCLLCVRSCPVQTIIHNPPDLPVIKTDKCIRCLCCHELCPHRAISLHKSLLARLVLSNRNGKKGEEQ